MNTVLKDVVVEYIEKKSLFIASLKRVNNEYEARQFINEISNKYNDANHNVYSYRIKNDKEYIKYSDDGEPLNTAGKPSYEILNILDIYNVVVVITRYFGGIKLGAGGLIRAYAKSTKLAVMEAQIIEYILKKEYLLSVDYKNSGMLDNYIMKNNIEILEKSYTDKVNYKVNISNDVYNNLISLKYIDIINLGE